MSFIPSRARSAAPHAEEKSVHSISEFSAASWTRVRRQRSDRAAHVKI